MPFASGSREIALTKARPCLYLASIFTLLLKAAAHAETCAGGLLNSVSADRGVVMRTTNQMSYWYSPAAWSGTLASASAPGKGRASLVPGNHHQAQAGIEPLRQAQAQCRECIAVSFSPKIPSSLSCLLIMLALTEPKKRPNHIPARSFCCFQSGVKFHAVKINF